MCDAIDIEESKGANAFQKNKEEKSEQEENWMMATMVLYNNNGKTILKDTVHMSVQDCCWRPVQ